MVHRADYGTLEADQVPRKGIVEDLPAPVLECLVPKCPSGKQREELRAMRPLAEDHGSGFGHQLAALEIGDEFQLLRTERPELGHCPQRALFTGNTAG